MVFAFGDCELDVEKHELRRAGALVPVEPQVFALLVHLVREHRRVVSKDELIEAIWEGRFVSDSAVSSRVKSARQALGDDGQAQKYIKTVHGKGFRFVADVTAREDAPAATAELPSAAPRRPAAQAAPPAAGLTGRIGKRTGLAALAALALVIMAGLWLTLFPGGGQAAVDHARIAVLPTQNATGQSDLDWARLGLMSLASDRIAKTEGLYAVAPSAVLSLVGEDEEGSGALDLAEQTDVQLRHGQGASHIVLSRLTRANGLLKLDFVVIPPSGQRETGSVGGEKVAELADMMVRRIVARIAGGAPADLPASRLFDDPFVSEAYARGLALDLEGKAEEARELFAVAMKQEPDSIWPRYEYAISTRKMGLLDEAQEQLVALRTEAQQRKDDEALVSILNALGVLGMRRNETDPAIAYLVEALPLSEARGDAERTGTICVNLGILERRKGDFAKAESYLTRAFTAFDAAGITPPPGPLLNTMALLRYEQGRRNEAQAYLERARDRFRQDGNGRALASVLNNLGDLRENAGDYKAALAYYEQSYDQRKALNDPFGIDASLGALAQLSVRMGRLDDAEGYARELLKAGEARDDDAERARGHVYLGEVYRYRRDAGFARQHYERSIALFEKAERQVDVMRVRIDLALAELLAGNSAKARQHADAAKAWALKQERHRELMAAEGVLGQIAQKAGQADAAQAHYQAALAASRQLSEPVHQGRVLARLGLVALESGNRAAAARYAQEAGRFIPNEADLFRLRAGLARLEGKPADAAKHMERAKALAGETWSPGDEASLAALKAV